MSPRVDRTRSTELLVGTNELQYVARQRLERSRLNIHHVFVEPGWAAHGLTGVVDDGIEPLARCRYMGAECLDTWRVAQVKAEDLEPVAPLGEVRFGCVTRCSVAREACGDDQFSAASEQLDAGLISDFDASACEEDDHAGHVGELAALVKVQGRAGRAELVVEVVDLAISDLADIAVLRFECLAERSTVGSVLDVALLEVVGWEGIRGSEHRTTTQRPDAGLVEGLLVSSNSPLSTLLLKQFRASPANLGGRVEHVAGRIEEVGLFLRIEMLEKLRCSDN